MLYISVVIFNTSINDLSKLFDSFTKIKTEFRVIIIDNSKLNSLKFFFKEFNFVDYIHNPSNPGFGASHNIAIKKSINDKIKYHFIVNPDVYFTEDVVTKMVTFVENHQDVGMLMPQILNLDGSIQNLPKLLPSPFSVLLRKLKKPKFIYEPFISKYELRKVDKSMIYEAPILSGCFTLLNIEIIKNIGLYDDDFFMYFEDWDLSRRVHEKYKTIYYPLAAVYHGYESGANKSKHLFKIFIKSCIHYFNKYGWFFDAERKKINHKALQQFK